MSFRDVKGLVSKQFKNFLIFYSKSFKKIYNRKGSLLLDNIQRIAITDENYFTNMICYIHFNSFLHGFAKNLFQWKYSSIHVYYTEKRSLNNRKDVTDWLGGIEPFKQFSPIYSEGRVW